jgi:short-subunit dehydrogenase
VIIGAISGLGRTIALLAARDGLVNLVRRSREALDELAAEVGGTGRRAIALSIDLREPVSVKRIADAPAEPALDPMCLVPALACP